MGNYSGTPEQQLAKRRAYDKARQETPEYRAWLKARMATPEYKAKAAAWAKKYRHTDAFRAKARAYKHTQAYKDKRRDGLLRKQFGIGLDEYTALLDAQHGVCAICSRIDPVRSLAVDHCHTTGKVRGLLCRDCNQGLGLYQDNIERLKRAADYLYVCRDHSNT